MTLFLRRRSASLRERMDDPGCDPILLHNTYAQFGLVNRLVSGWQRVFRQQLLPLARRSATLLDVGCGGGDLAVRLAQWAREEGVTLRVTAIDPDPRALAFARARPAVQNVRFLQVTAAELAADGASFDVVLSHHLLHHLNEAELGPFLEDTAALALQRVVHNDIRRSDLALAAFTLTRPFFRRSFITEDGLRSIRRSFTTAELAALAPAGWHVQRLAPYRNLLVLDAV
jgi:2-polyprenyl-3-methyl-5-hydroxy-6-metoxy-1,4-benzoquinol methylase